MDITLGKSISFYKNSHDALIRSMDIKNAATFEVALENYKAEWFKYGEPYLSIALKLCEKKNSTNIVKWNLSILVNMLEEIAVYNNINTDHQITMVKCAMSKQISMSKLRDELRNFDQSHKYKCPDTFKAHWMNYGAYATLMYDTLYDTTLSPAEINAKTLQLMMNQNHDVDYELLKQIYDKYKI